MTRDIDLFASASRDSSETRTPIGVRHLTEAGKANSRERGACPVASILATTRVSVSGVKGRVLIKAIPAVVATGLVTGTSITVGNNKEKSMKHRHIHAKKGEWIHVHRENDSGAGCLGIVIVILVIGFLIRGC